jgi:hypothetical protein
MRLINLILIAIGILSANVALCQEECELKKDQNGIKVFSCTNNNSKFNSIKASFEIEATAPQLAAMVMDIAGYTKWQYKTIEASILKTISQRELIYYVEIMSPWPASNRDFVVHLKIEQDSLTKKMVFRFRGIPDYIPDKKGIIRVPMSRSTWRIEPTAFNKLKIEYSMEMDPSGLVPGWLMNKLSAEGPYESFFALKNSIQSRNYSKSDAPFILE